jgi:hypothetical protein
MKRLTAEEVEGEIVALDGMDVHRLRDRWREAYKTEPPPKVKSGLLRLAVAYRIQEKAFGGLKPKSIRQMQDHLAAMANGATPDTRPGASHRLAPGTQLMREWNGQVMVVDVVDGGFRWKDRAFKTLSAVAVAITGTKWSGPKFFGLTTAKEPAGRREAVSQ